MARRTKTKLREAVNALQTEEEKTSVRSNGKEDFSEADAELDLSSFLAKADEVDDAAVQAQIIDNRGKKRRREVPLKELGESEDEPDEEEEPIVYDPEFDIMVTSLVNDVVDKIQEKKQWSDPGMHWRTKVGGCVARIAQKRLIRGRKLTDEVVLLGYLAIWIIPNAELSIPFKRKGKNPDIAGHNRFGQDVPIEGAS